MRSRAALLLAAALVAAPATRASIFVADDPVGPRLAVDARGSAQITWTRNGARQSVIVPSKGQLSHGGSLSGPDVSRPAPGVRVPLAVLVRRGPGGLLYALQRWQPQPNGPVELHFARCSGARPCFASRSRGRG